MAKKCIYCKSEISEDSIVDFCEKCGKGVWGEKMFKTITKNMKDADKKGNLKQGLVDVPKKNNKPQVQL